MLITKGGIWVACALPGGPNAPPMWNQNSAYRAAQEFVLEHLKQEAGRMSESRETAVTQEDATTFKVKGWVDTKNWLLLIVRRKYEVTMAARKGPLLIDIDASLIDITRNGLLFNQYHWSAVNVSVK